MEGMAGPHQTSGRDEPVDRFRPTSGQVVGNLTLAAVGGVVAYLLLTERTVTGLRVGTGVVFFGVLVWLTVLRPRATAYPKLLHIHNSVRDVLIPYVAIDRVAMGRVLTVWVDGRRHVCTGIGAPRHGAAKRHELVSGAARATGLDGGPADVGYADYVQARIEGLVEDEKRRARHEAGATHARPRHVWAWPGLVALSGTGAAFLLTLLLL